jgi:hypothetical protein
VTAGLPFTGDDEASFAFCEEDEAPTTAGGWDPVATIGAWADFLGAPAAEAYEEAVVAGVLFAWMGFCWLAGDVIWGVRCRSRCEIAVVLGLFFFVGVEGESGIDGAGCRVGTWNYSKLQRGNKIRRRRETHKSFPFLKINETPRSRAGRSRRKKRR